MGHAFAALSVVTYLAAVSLPGFSLLDVGAGVLFAVGSLDAHVAARSEPGRSPARTALIGLLAGALLVAAVLTRAATANEVPSGQTTELGVLRNAALPQDPT